MVIGRGRGALKGVFRNFSRKEVGKVESRRREGKVEKKGILGRERKAGKKKVKDGNVKMY